MGENIQCPVCTLFLHAGMNLSDHLETHPKEQVIRALVQLTISGGGSGVGAALANALSCSDSIDKKEFLENSASISDSEFLTKSSSTSTVSGSFTDTTAKTNSANISKDSLPTGTVTHGIPSRTNEDEPPTISDSNKERRLPPPVDENENEKPQFDHPSLCSQTKANTDQKLSIPAQSMAYQHHRDYSLDYIEQENDNQQLSTSQVPANNQLKEQTIIVGHQLTTGAMTTVPLPSPSMSALQLKSFNITFPNHSELTSSLQHHSQHQQQYNSQNQQVALQQQFNRQQQPYFQPNAQQQQQNHKAPFTSSLPPPPPLQLFNNQTSQHQKPPPAYGAAINQIRSQHNLNKLYQQQQHHKHNSIHQIATISTSKNQATIATSKASTDVLPATDINCVQHPKSNTSIMQTLQQKTSPVTAAAAAVLVSNSNTVTSTIRQTTSPLSASPSVLRYAESPVAHYLERDNGDFIVQETPKHIVECIEKDNGEFSVIERIYQSPPSVLHIHDDNDENDDGDDEADESNSSSVPVNNSSNNKTSTKKRQIRKMKKFQSSATIGKKSLQCQDDQKKEEEFMSLSSDYESGADTTDLQESSSQCINKTTKVSPPILSLVPSTSAAALGTSSIATDSSFSDNTPTSSKNAKTLSTSFVNNNALVTQKSKKNAITVLSDVSLNMNEYLDLVGNIFASNKLHTQKDFSPKVPLSLVKVKKEEPLDEYENEQGAAEDDREHSTHVHEDEEHILNRKALSPNLLQNVNNETELVEVFNGEIKQTLSANIKETKCDTFACNIKQQNEQICATTLSTNHAATSVIRMASTSQQSQKVAPNVTTQNSLTASLNGDIIKEDYYTNALPVAAPPIMKCEIEPTRLTAQRFPPQALKLRGPKKLIIKPKSTLTPNQKTLQTDNDNIASTSAAAAASAGVASSVGSGSDEDVLIKNEPITNSYDCQSSNRCGVIGNNLQSTSNENNNSSIFKISEQPLLRCSAANDDDARVLLDFANSKPQSVIGNTTFVVNTNAKKSVSCLLSAVNASVSVDFPSAGSMFSSNARKPTIETISKSVESSSDEYILPDNSDIDEEGIVISTSSYSSQSANDITPTENNVSSHPQTDSKLDSLLTSHTPPLNNFTDFNFLYNPAMNVTPFAYQSRSHGHDGTNSATVATSSASSSVLLDDSLSISSSHQQSHSKMNSRQEIVISNTTPTGSLWYQNQPTNFNAALAVDCNAAVDGVGDMVGSKYLDLDTCKRENSKSNSHTTSALAISASTSSSSFNAAGNECSMAGACTIDTLNIRTDERMPAKGEISEQESNCDVDNSWSQSMYGDISARFFRTTFPGMYNPDNIGWNNEDCFRARGLTATTSAGKSSKSFDFRLPLEATTSATECGHSDIHMHLLNDALPSTSTASKKKRKRLTNMPTATITSQEMLNQLEQQREQSNNQALTHSGMAETHPITSHGMLLAGPSTADTSLSPVTGENNANTSQRRTRKIYKCAHCPIIFTKLKDRSAHLVAEHNYVRRNRRLVCMQSLVTPTPTSEVLVVAASSSSNFLPVQTRNDASIEEDSKHGIIKIKMEQGSMQNQVLEQDEDQGYDELPAEAHVLATLGGDHDDTKAEYADVKDGCLVVNAKTELSRVDNVGSYLDTKPSLQRVLYGKQIPTTKLATLYRMLMGYNAAKLRQDRELTEEERIAIENSIFLCYTCLTDFPSVKLYDAHLTEHPAECFTCGKKFYRWKNFSLHLKRHLGWKEFGCYICDKKFVVRSALVEHMRMHTGQAPLKCNICGKKFKRYSNLTQHRKRHTKQIIRKKEYVCHCGEVLPSKARFLWHKETHDSKPKCCPHCCDRFIHANSLRRHIRLAHSDKFNYTEPMECPMCKQVFAKTSIKAHMATHSESAQYDCAICNKSFSTKWNLKMHSWVHANRTAKPFKCEHCPKAFVRELDFKNHMNSHKQIKPYTCEYCGCKFIRKYNYMRHRREHHGHKKFTCDLCDKSFHRHYYLIEHRRIHTGERPFQCTICGKSSTTKTNHNKHLKIHHSRDPFTVEV